MEKHKQIVLLTDTNYATWKFQIKMLLQQKSLFHTITYKSHEGYLTNEELMDAQDIEKLNPKELAKMRKEWNRDNEKACVYIGQSVDTKFYKYIADQTSANQVWSNLEVHFSSLINANRLSVKVEFYAAQQMRSESLLTYLERVIAITDKLKDLGWETKDLEICIKVLSSLTDEYRTVQLSCLMIPEKELTTSFLRQQFAMDVNSNEKKKTKTDGEAQANYTGVKLCTECGYDNHFARNCHAPQSRKDAYKAKLAQNNSDKNKKAQAHNTETAVTFITGVSSPDTSTVHQTTSTCNAVGTWYLDSCASHHMTNDPTMVKNTTESSIKVLGSLSTEQNISSTRGDSQVNEMLPLHDVLVVPDLRKNLVSVSKITDDDSIEVRFKGDSVSILQDNSLVGKGKKDAHGIYAMDSNLPQAEANLSMSILSMKECHLRMGHLSMGKIKELEKLSKGITISSSQDLECTCSTCCLGKQIRAKIPSSSVKVRSEVFGDYIHSDVCGPISPVSMGGNSYYVSFIDDFTGMSFLYLMKEKSEVSSLFLQFRKLAKTQFSVKLKRIHSDRGGEYIANTLSDFCKKKGIIHTFTPPDTPQLNGVAERYNRSILETARCLIISKSIDKVFWGEAVITSNFLRNRSPLHKIGMTPYEKLYNKKPNLANIRVFGSRVFYIPATYKTKLENRSNPGILVGFSDTDSCYKIWDTDRKKSFWTRDVKFVDEFVCYSPIPSNVTPDSSSSIKDDDVIVISNSSSEDDSINYSSHPRPLASNSSDEETISFGKVPNRDVVVIDSTSTSQAVEEEASEDSDTLSFGKLPQQSNEASALSIQSLISNDPQSYEEAINSDNSNDWKKAMLDEIRSFIDNDVFISIPDATNQRFIDSKWVFKTKIGSDGKVVRFKARLVAKGYKQTYGIDYTEVYAPVIRYETLRYIISHATYTGMQLRHFDVETAFLNGDLEEKIYLKFPNIPSSSISNDLSHSIVLLKKSVYGLKQSGRNWNLKFVNLLLQLGFKQSQVDLCLFQKGEGKNQMLIGIFVDDMICSGDSNSLNSIYASLSAHFKLKDLGELKTILGIEVNRLSKNEIHLSQKFFALSLLGKFGMTDCKPVSTPAIIKSESHEDKKEFSDVKLFQQVVGSLNYLSISTRPDITFAVYSSATHMVSPTQGDWIELKRILRYLKGTVDCRMVYKCNGAENLHGFSDSSFANGTGMKSISGYVFFMNLGPISWKTKRQAVIALSTTEAEYIGLNEAARESAWLRELNAEINGKGYESIVIFEDNQSSIQSSKGQTDHFRTKHIDVRYHYIRECVAQKKISLSYCPTEEMTADIFTKPLGKILFARHCKAMSLIY